MGKATEKEEAFEARLQRKHSRQSERFSAKTEEQHEIGLIRKGRDEGRMSANQKQKLATDEQKATLDKISSNLIVERVST